jgi:integrase
LIRSCLKPDARDLVTVAVATGLRWGELTALFKNDIDFETGLLTVRRAWKRQDPDNPVEKKHTKAKHKMNGMYLGAPKTKRSRRTVSVQSVLPILERLTDSRAQDDFVFVSLSGERVPLRNQVFYEHRWQPALDEAKKHGLPMRPRFHDLRHTFVGWLIQANVPLPVIQQLLGHESIQTTIDVYGRRLPKDYGLVDAAIAAALRGEKVTTALRSVA